MRNSLSVRDVKTQISYEELKFIQMILSKSDRDEELVHY